MFLNSQRAADGGIAVRMDVLNGLTRANRKPVACVNMSVASRGDELPSVNR
ncbi:MAG: hypothetical protein Q4C80_06610 [Bacillota bacterium]|nr:hypothetical protein [Bacillota bacterium]